MFLRWKIAATFAAALLNDGVYAPLARALPDVSGIASTISGTLDNLPARQGRDSQRRPSTIGK